MSEPKQYIHQELASGRWHTLTLAEQVGNVGSEYERAWRWKQKGNAQYFEGAQARLFELLDLTIEDSRWSSRRLKKLSSLRDVIVGELCDAVCQQPGSLDLGEYFLRVGLLANKQRTAARNQQSVIGNRK